MRKKTCQISVRFRDAWGSVVQNRLSSQTKLRFTKKIKQMWFYKYWSKQKGLFVGKMGGEMIPMNEKDGWGQMWALFQWCLVHTYPINIFQ